MANKTVTVKASGGDYSSLNAALSGEAANLVTGTCILTIECYNFEDTTAADTGTAYTTNSSYYINIVTPTSERHDGKWSTSAYRHVVSNASNLIIREAYTRVVGLQFQITSVGATDRNNIQYPVTQANYAFVSHCICVGVATTYSYHAGVSIWNDSNITKIFNCLFYDFRFSTTGTLNCGVHLYAGSGEKYVANCTFVDCRYGVTTYTSTLNLHVYNCLFSGSQTNDFSESTSGTVTVLNSATTRANFGLTGATETDCRYSQSFTFVDSANDDYHLGSADGGALGFGKNLYNDANIPFQDDIDGDDRGGSGASWDIGADEYVAAGAVQKSVAGALPAMAGVLTRKLMLKRTVQGAI